MPELPDLEAYLAALRPRLLGQEFCGLRLGNPFLLRSVEPAPAMAIGHKLMGLTRLGKRLVFAIEGEIFFVLHLMLGGRLHWKKSGARLLGKSALCAFDFAPGCLLLSEAGSKRRAALHVVQGAAALTAHDPGGLEPLSCDLPTFAARLRSENHTLKRALTTPQLFAGIGNAYSDEILFAARLSPFERTQALDDQAVQSLWQSMQGVLRAWTERLCGEASHKFPEKVSAFRPEMAVHGRSRAPCRQCQAPIQRVRLAQSEFQYCARCQTGGRILADRALSKLLHEDWPRRIEDLE